MIEGKRKNEIRRAMERKGKTRSYVSRMLWTNKIFYSKVKHSFAYRMTKRSVSSLGKRGRNAVVAPQSRSIPRETSTKHHGPVLGPREQSP